MSLIDDLAKKVGSAGPALRTALIAECVGRMYKICEEEEGSLSKQVDRSLEAGWASALGRPVDDKTVEKCLTGINRLVDSYLDDDNELPGTYCVLVKRLLESFSPTTPKKEVGKAFGRAMATYLDLVDLTGEDKDREKKWQEKALGLIAGWKDSPRRDMFASLPPLSTQEAPPPPPSPLYTKKGKAFRPADVQAAKAGNAGPTLRTALLAECMERLLPIYEKMREREGTDAFQQIIDFGWAFALGQSIDKQALEACELKLGGETYFHYDQKNDTVGNLGMAFFSTMKSLSRVKKTAYEAFGSGLASYLAATELAEEALNQTLPPESQKTSARDQELAWQDKALALIAGWEGLPRRGMFDPLGNKPPAWLGDRFAGWKRKGT